MARRDWEALRASSSVSVIQQFRLQVSTAYSLNRDCQRAITDEAAARITELNAAGNFAGASSTLPRACAACPEMIVVPSAEVLMGEGAYSLFGARGRDPLRIVRVRSFAISRTEVTLAQFAAFARATRRLVVGDCMDPRDRVDSSRSWRTPGFAQSDQHPVVCVNLDDALAYAMWLSRMTGLRYRLPSGDEWENAALAGDLVGLWFPTANRNSYSMRCSFANGADEALLAVWSDYLAEDCNDGVRYTAAVASFPANRFGLYDMAGNVNEWVLDCALKQLHLEEPPGDAAPIDGCRSAQLRGGGWGSHLHSLRGWGLPAWTERASDIGFRVAMDL